MLAALVDPLGLATLLELTQYWTAAERNTRLVGFPATLVWNRCSGSRSRRPCSPCSTAGSGSPTPRTAAAAGDGAGSVEPRQSGPGR